jgi:hypothetical protein
MYLCLPIITNFQVFRLKLIWSLAMGDTYTSYIIFLELISPVFGCRVVSRCLNSGITLGEWTTCINFMHCYSVVREALWWANLLSKVYCQLNVQRMTKTAEENRLRINKQQRFKNHHWNSGSRWVMLCRCTSSQLLNTFSEDLKSKCKTWDRCNFNIYNDLFHVMMY